eukprot:CAMPEP_0170387810 /NCGR_PEP_ID=MMETSP0117_2-20130122/17754_1 /TAXON_ID=400756 /ORGANISM="Durinskia baltica, Strain CSIRO CS-38" /LENGTH=220 /DNA_ID=CAMNT_0010643699 /DNA_START=28 /DNA_END=690 /DNA_ORIENTATION=-
MYRVVALSKIAIRAKQFHSSKSVAKLIVEKVPALGESITEGSIASWAKNTGDKVAVDDVIVIVETDKVTVDIKSTHAGVFTRRLAEENVIVGNDLYEIDTDGASSSSSAPKKSDAPVPPPSPAPAQSPTATGHSDHNNERGSDHHRKPLIKFIGKRDKKPHPPSNKSSAMNTQSQQPQAKAPVKEGSGVHFTTLQGMAFFGRPTLSLKEIEAIESGGATL